MVRILTLFLITSLALLGAAGPAQPAKKSPKMPKIPKVTGYLADIEISGAIRIHSHWDSTSSCLPGQAWTLTERAAVEFKGRTTVSVVRGRVGVGLIRNKRAISQESDLGGYRTTNYCEEPPVQLPKPQCIPKTVGNGGAFMQSFPGQKKRVVVFITRTSGSNQHSSCQTSPVEADSLDASIHALPRKHHHLRLPLKIQNIGFHNMKPGWKHRTRINVNGPCNDAKITTPESGWVTNQSIPYDGCTVSAWFRVTIARVKPKKAQGKKAKAKRPKAMRSR